MFLFLLGGIHLPILESKYLKIFSLPGKFSYGNYLFHIMAIYFLNAILKEMNIVMAFVVFASAVTAISAISYYYFENPANKWVRKCFHVG